jgi:hypothetical protein
MVGAIFVHFDDNSTDIQSSIFTSLKYAAQINPSLVLKHATQQLTVMKNK